ncbi:MAG: ABC transporter permease subunit [Thermodesulfobacteriota bacterium]|nr:ABC transporter permease subunit [Thermodesulfobacteriota bacterium]
MKKILIVEDNVNQLDTLRKILSSNFEVVTATNLEEANKSLETNLDLILTDIRLDDSDRDNNDGIVLLAEAQKKHPSLPVIMMTAYGGTMIESEARKMGAYDFLQKPINLDELDDVISRALTISKIPLYLRCKKKIGGWIPALAFFVLFMTLWELSVKIFDIPNYLIPAPHIILSEIITSFSSLLQDIGVTMLEAVLGFLIGNALGICFAVALVHSSFIKKSVYPYIVGSQAIPIIAIAPLLTIWFGNGLLGKVTMAVLICFFPATVNATIGFKSVSNDALDLMKSLSGSKYQVFVKLRLPSSLPFLFSAFKISSTLSIIGAIVAELAGSETGIGFRILISSYQINTNMLFASLVVSALAGIIFYQLIALLERRIIKWTA